MNFGARAISWPEHQRGGDAMAGEDCARCEVKAERKGRRRKGRGKKGGLERGSGSGRGGRGDYKPRKTIAASVIE